jgi:hypothetical protein
MLQEALNLLVADERYWALFYTPLYTCIHVYMFLHNLPNVLVQIANKMGLQKKSTHDYLFYNVCIHKLRCAFFRRVVGILSELMIEVYNYMEIDECHWYPSHTQY